MKKILILMLVLGMTSMASAALTLSGDLTLLNAGATGTIQVISDADGGYGMWIGIADITSATYDGDPTFTPAGNPNGDSLMTNYDPSWYGEVIVSSLNPGAPILPGAHININLVGVTENTETMVEIRASDGVTVLDSVKVTVLPEPMTIALLGLGGLFILRRRK
ncbi:MAG: PEP-CTERM sorting domain-containing protein [Planctomycetota bacterium]